MKYIRNQIDKEHFNKLATKYDEEIPEHIRIHLLKKKTAFMINVNYFSLSATIIFPCLLHYYFPLIFPIDNFPRLILR